MMSTAGGERRQRRAIRRHFLPAKRGRVKAARSFQISDVKHQVSELFHRHDESPALDSARRQRLQGAFVGRYATVRIDGQDAYVSRPSLIMSGDALAYFFSRAPGDDRVHQAIAAAVGNVVSAKTHRAQMLRIGSQG